MIPSRILLVDDDKTLLDVLRYRLEKEDYDVITAADGIEAVSRARSDRPDLVILDIMLPGLNGFEVCRILRNEMTVPILMLTAKTEEIDRVVGLELGADDYVTKPFGIRELLARVRAALRRSQAEHHQPAEDSTSSEEHALRLIKAGSLEVDIGRHAASRDGVELQLSRKEFELLAYLMRHRGQAFSRERLVDQLWGYDYIGTSRTVDVHVRSLRCKIEDDPPTPTRIVTIHSVGYKFEG